jgi:hypothetical protein
MPISAGIEPLLPSKSHDVNKFVLIDSIFAPVLTVFDYMHYLKLAKFVLPTINERLKTFGRDTSDDENLPLYEGKKPVRSHLPSP